MVSFEVAVIILIAACIASYLLGFLQAPEPNKTIGNLCIFEDASGHEDAQFFMDIKYDSGLEGLCDGEYVVVRISKTKYDSTQKKHGL